MPRNASNSHKLSMIQNVMLAMANAWLTLAEQRVKNSETILVYEMPTTANQPP